MISSRLALSGTPEVVTAGCSTSPSAQDASTSTIDYPAPPAAPDGGYPYCYGESIPEAGPCCESFVCIDRTDGGAACPSPNDPAVNPAVVSCGCGGNSGPYSDDASPGRCCYITRVRACM